MGVYICQNSLMERKSGGEGVAMSFFFISPVPPCYILPILTFQYWTRRVGPWRSVGNTEEQEQQEQRERGETESPREELRCVCDGGSFHGSQNQFLWSWDWGLLLMSCTKRWVHVSCWLLVLSKSDTLDLENKMFFYKIISQMRKCFSPAPP